MQIIQQWFKRNFSDPQVVSLAVLLVLGFATVILMGKMLASVLVAIVIAYLLEALVQMLQRHRFRRLPAVLLVFGVFFTLFVLTILILVPLLFGQVSQLVQELPGMVGKGQKVLMQLPESYPQYFSPEQVKELSGLIRARIAQWGQGVLSFSIASIPSLIALAVYLILVPLLVFLLLKDKWKILDWLHRFMPKQRTLAVQVWKEMDQQIGNYVRGKVIEIVIVGVVSYVVFAIMGLRFSMLLGALVGFSVIIPYIGATVVTIPVALIGYFQWGWGSEFAYLLLAYGIIQALDGNVLVPLLFSEAVNLHPVAIIVAVVVFGGIWGFWGVFFAIPLATLVKAVINAWPRLHQESPA